MNIYLATPGSCLSIIGLLLLLATGCADREVDKPEDRIHQYIEAGKQAAENRDTGALAALIAEDYQDDRQLDKASLIKLSRGYFLRHKNIHLFTRIDAIRLDVPPDQAQRAEVEVYVAMAGQPISHIEALSGIHARLYRFELLLIDDGGEWQLLSARWKRARLKEFFGQE